MAEHSSGDAITLQKIRPQFTGSGMEVRSAAFPDEGAIPERFSQYGDGISPPLDWDAHPDAKAYALIVEDPDAPRPEPFLHWIAWNIPADVTSLPEGLTKTDRPPEPHGMIQGRNGAGSTGWYGCKPPPGHGPHRYHFQVFALSEPFEMAGDAPYEELLNALIARVLAEGEMGGTFERPATQ